MDAAEAAKARDERIERYDRRYAASLRKLCGDPDFRMVVAEWLMHRGQLLQPGANSDYDRGRQSYAAEIFQNIRQLVPAGAAMIMHEELTDEYRRNDRG